MGERSLRTCAEEAVDAIRKNMPSGSDLSEWFTMHPNFDAGNRQINYYVGYLEGIADAFDMTTCEVLDHLGIDYSTEQPTPGES